MKAALQRLACLFLISHGCIQAFVSRRIVSVASRLSAVPDKSCQSKFQALSEVEGKKDPQWIDHGLLLSSFSDGLVPNCAAMDFLLRGLVKGLWREYLRQVEADVKESVLQSPCCGPDLKVLSNMESADKVLGGLADGRLDWRHMLQCLSDKKNAPIELRFLYIPTAMYALRKDSTASPGKQRQRARADGKKRRTEIVNLIATELSEHVDVDVNVLTVTLDLDDGSVKQPEGSDNPSKFPETGVVAIKDWAPHFIYVQGGNTFWLYHCIEKGNWGELIYEACTGEDAAVYCGTSAGAIVLGATMETACWKGWDDPSLVPDRPTYDDWKDIKGFQMAGNKAFFPHMTDEWRDLVEKQKSLDPSFDLVILRDEDAYCIEGSQKKVYLAVAEKSL